MKNISAIIATYNNASYLKEAVDSVLNQTYQDVEIIVVDDGSTDNTRDLIESMRSIHSRVIQYIYQKNQGPASARNTGMRAAQGKYISFLDADDTWLPDKLQKQVDVLEARPHVGFVYSDNFFIDEQGSVIEGYIRKIKLVNGNILLDLYLNFFLITSGIMMRKECIDSIGFFNEDLLVGEDYEYFLRLAKVYEAEVIVEKLWKRMIRKNSLSRQDYQLDARNDLKILKEFLGNNPVFLEEHKDQIFVRLADYHFSFGYQLLENGHNLLAFLHFLKSIKYKFSLKALKNIFFCVIPHGLRRTLKEKLCQKLV